MRDELKPGVTENDLWGYLNLVNAQSGGERVETKLLTSGYRTNPWY